MRIIIDIENFKDNDSIVDVCNNAEVFTIISDGKEIVVTPETKVATVLKLTVKPKKPSLREKAVKWLSEE